MRLSQEAAVQLPPSAAEVPAGWCREFGSSEVGIYDRPLTGPVVLAFAKVPQSQFRYYSICAVMVLPLFLKKRDLSNPQTKERGQTRMNHPG